MAVTVLRTGWHFLPIQPSTVPQFPNAHATCVDPSQIERIFRLAKSLLKCCTKGYSRITLCKLFSSLLAVVSLTMGFAGIANASPFIVPTLTSAASEGPSRAPTSERKNQPAAKVSPEAANTKAAPSQQERKITFEPTALTKRPGLLEKRNVPPFWFDQTYETHRTRTLAFPPIFIHRAPKPKYPQKFFHADLSFTFGWYAKRLDRRRWFNPLVLYFGGYSERKTVWGVIPLLMGYKRLGDQFNFGQFPLFWWWGNKNVKQFFAVPFHFQRKTPNEFFGASALLFWYGHKNIKDDNPDNDKRHFVAAPLFWRFQSGQRRVDVSLLYGGGFNKYKGLKHHTLFPFFHWQSNEFGNRREFWSFAWIHRTDRARNISSWVVPPLLTFHRKTLAKSLFSATPLFWRAKNYYKGSTTTVAGPFVLHDDPRQRNNVLFPLWWQFYDKANRTRGTGVFPLAFVRTSQKKTSVWTLLGGGSRAKDNSKSYQFGAFPLLTYGHRRPDGRSLQTVLGLFWHRKTPATKTSKLKETWLLAPLFYHRKHGIQTDWGIPPLLTFAGEKGTFRFQTVTPLFWHARNRDPKNPFHATVLAPFYFAQTKHGFHSGLPPIGVFGKDQHYRYNIVPPLLFVDLTERKTGQRHTVSPVFTYGNGPKQRVIGVLNVAWDIKRKNERHSLLFPLYYRRQIGSKIITITPFGGGIRDKNRSLWIAGPAFGSRNKKNRSFGFVPFAFHHQGKTADNRPISHTGVIPLYFRRRAPSDDLDMWTPLVWRSHVRGTKPRKGLAVIPFYFRQRQPKGVDVDAGLPFFYSRNKTRRTHTMIGGPFFHRLSRTQLNTGTVPLYWWMDSQTKRRLIALPLTVHVEDKKAKQHTTIGVPFWFDRQRSEYRRTWVAFPFVAGRRRQYNFMRFSLLPPGYVDRFNLKKNWRFTGYVPLLFRYTKCGFQKGDDPKCQYNLWGSFPLFLAGRDGHGRQTHGALMLYYFDKDPEGWKFWTLPFGVSHKPGKELGWYAFPMYWKTTQTHKRLFVFPVFYHKRHRVADESTTVALPPLYIGQHKRDRRWWQSSLLVWQFRKQHKVTTAVIPPIFLHSHAYKQRKFTWLLPLFVRDNHMAKDTAWTSIIPGLYVQKRHKDKLDFVQFPLVWRIHGKRTEFTMGGLMWWDIRKNGNTTQVVPALFFRRDTKKRTLGVVGPGLAWWTKAKEKNAGDIHWRGLFGLFGGGSEDGQRYAFILGAKIKLKNRSAK